MMERRVPTRISRHAGPTDSRNSPNSLISWPTPRGRGWASPTKRILPDEARVLNVRGLAEYLKVHPGTVHRLIRTAQLPAFRVGNGWRFNREQIDRWRFEREKTSEI